MAGDTLRDCIDEFLVYAGSIKGLSPNTITGYRNDFVHLTDHCGTDRKVFLVTTEDLRTTIGQLSKRKYSIASINRYIVALRGFFAYCKKRGFIKQNPAVLLKTLKLPKRLPKYMTQAEVDALCRQPEVKELLWQSRDKALFEMFYSTGCRVSELASLTFSDISRNMESAVVHGKGNKDRTVFIEKDARIALKKYLLERHARFPQADINGANPVRQIFINQQGTALSAMGMRYIVNRYSGIEGVNKQVSPHAFRHTFATAMLNNGADIRVVQEFLGHSSLSTTQRYTHVTTQKLKEVYNQAFPHSGKKD